MVLSIAVLFLYVGVLAALNMWANEVKGVVSGNVLEARRASILINLEPACGLYYNLHAWFNSFWESVNLKHLFQ